MTNIRNSRQQLGGGLTLLPVLLGLLLLQRLIKKINTFTFNKLYIFRCINNSHLTASSAEPY